MLIGIPSELLCMSWRRRAPTPPSLLKVNSPAIRKISAGPTARRTASKMAGTMCGRITLQMHSVSDAPSVRAL